MCGGYATANFSQNPQSRGIAKVFYDGMMGILRVLVISIGSECVAANRWAPLGKGGVRVCTGAVWSPGIQYSGAEFSRFGCDRQAIRALVGGGYGLAILAFHASAFSWSPVA